MLHSPLGPFLVRIPGEARATAGAVSSFPIDRDLSKSSSKATLDTRLRIGLEFETLPSASSRWTLAAVYRHEFLVGTVAGRPEGIAGESLPHDELIDQAWRMGYVKASYDRWITLAAGLQLSHWGLGLLANDADHGAEFGSGRFSLPYAPDQSLRASLTVLPFYTLSGSPARGLAFFFAADRVWSDFNARYLDDDKAWQGVGAVKWILGAGTDLGLYAVRRFQTNADGKSIRVSVLDAAGQARWRLRSDLALVGGYEIAGITGTTTLVPTVSYPEHDVKQLGAAATVGVEPRNAGAWLDFVYASGDQNLYDRDQNAFHSNRSFDVGFLLFREIIRYQTGRAAATAGNRNLVGVPAEDLNRVASEGTVTNAIVVSPRGSYRPLPWLETYGRPVFAWTSVPWADPFNTNLAGGVPRNALNAVGGRYYGTELDLGVRAQYRTEQIETLCSVEGGVLFPGSAFALPSGGNMDRVYGGRVTLRARF